MKTVFRLSCFLGAGAVLASFSAPANAAPLCGGPPAALMPFLPGLPNGCQRERIQVSGGLSFNMFRKAASLAEVAWQREVIARYGEGFSDLAFAACKSVLCEKGAVSGTERCTVSAYPCASDMDAPQKEQVARLSSMDAAPPVPPAPPPADDIRRHEEKAAQEEKESKAAKAAPEAAPQAEEKAPEPVQEKEWVKEKEPPREVERELNTQEVREMQRYLSRAGYNVHADGIFGDESRDALSAWERRAGLPDNGYPTYEMLERLRRDVR